MSCVGIVVCCFCRNGGGIGDSNIRKMSYFEGSKDPKYSVSNITYSHFKMCGCFVSTVYGSDHPGRSCNMIGISQPRRGLVGPYMDHGCWYCNPVCHAAATT